MNTDITSTLSTLSKCIQALLHSQSESSHVDAIDWRWNDVSCKLPEKLTNALRQIKRTLVNESRSTQSFREDQKDLKLQKNKNADVEYQESVHRVRFEFLHRSGLLTEEIFPLMEICSNELSPSQQGGLYIGEVKIDRCNALYRNAMRLLVAMTSLSDDPVSQRDERRFIQENSMSSLVTPAHLCVVLRYPSMLLIRCFQEESVGNDFELVDLTFRYITNVSKIISSDTTAQNAQRRFVEAFYDSGGIEFVILFVKMMTQKPPVSLEPMSSHTNILSFLGNCFSLLPDASRWAVMTSEIIAQQREKKEEAQNQRICLPGSARVLPRSMSKPLLTRTSKATGDAELCEYSSERDLSRYDRLDEAKHQKLRSNVYSKNATADLTEKTHATPLYHRSDSILGKLMKEFLENCFHQWLHVYWTGISRWSMVSDDGTEKFDEQEALKVDHPCPEPVIHFFSVLTSVTVALRDNLLRLHSHRIELEVDESRKPMHKELSTLFWNSLNILFGVGDTSRHPHEDNGRSSSSAHGLRDARSFMKILPTALKIASAVHRRKLKSEMLSILRFLFEATRTAVTFPRLISKQWIGMVIRDSDIWTKTEMMLHMASNSIGSHDLIYTNILISYTHVTVLLMGHVDPVEGEAAAVLSLSGDPKNIWPYLLSLQDWERNTLEANRAIQFLFNQMVNLQCQGPLLNVHLLFAIHDILSKTSRSSFGIALEMHKFARGMTGMVLSAFRSVGKKVGIGRLFFSLSNAHWEEVTSATLRYSITAQHPEASHPSSESESDVDSRQAEIPNASKTCRKVNKDKELVQDARKKLRMKKTSRNKKQKMDEINTVTNQSDDLPCEEIDSRSFTDHERNEEARDEESSSSLMWPEPSDGDTTSYCE